MCVVESQTNMTYVDSSMAKSDKVIFHTSQFHSRHVSTLGLVYPDSLPCVMENLICVLLLFIVSFVSKILFKYYYIVILFVINRKGDRAQLTTNFDLQA